MRMEIEQKYALDDLDSLQTKNAKVTIEYLGVDSQAYNISESGILCGELNAVLSSDKLLAFWCSRLKCGRLQKIWNLKKPRRLETG